MGTEGETAFGPREIRILNEAYLDIEEITDYIAIKKQQPLNAVKVARSLWHTIDKIGENPLAFKECEALPTKTKLYRRSDYRFATSKTSSRPGLLFLWLSTRRRRCHIT